MRGKLVDAKNGMTLDRAVEAAKQEGFLNQGDDINALLDRLNEEAHGKPVYRPSDEVVAADWEQFRREAQLRAHAAEEAKDKALAAEAEMGGNLSDEELDHAVQMLVDDPKMHPQEAVMQAARSGEDAALQHNVDRLAFGPPGVPPGAAVEPLADLQSLRQGVPADPQLTKDLAAARAFTRREHEVLDHASIQAILKRNGAGNFTVTEGTALNPFFDFANGVEKPGAPANVTKFLDDIEGSWRKLSVLERGKSFDPDHVAAVKGELAKNARDFMMAKFLAGVSSINTDHMGAGLIEMAKAAAFLRKNIPMFRASEMFTDDQIDGLLNWERTARMIARGNEMGRTPGSPTYKLLFGSGQPWMNLFISPWLRRGGAMAVDAGVATAVGSMFGHAGLGLMAGLVEHGVASQLLLDRFYSMPHARLIERLDEAMGNPQIAADLMRNQSANPGTFSEATKAWVRSLLVPLPARELAPPLRQKARAGTAQ
jgi:hypothetical protein